MICSLYDKHRKYFIFAKSPPNLVGGESLSNPKIMLSLASDRTKTLGSKFFVLSLEEYISK